MKSSLLCVMFIFATVVLGGSAAALAQDKARTPPVDTRSPQAGGSLDADRQRVELLTRVWRFDSARPAWCDLNAQIPQTEFTAPVDRECSFTLKLTVDLKPFDGEKPILNIPNVLNVRLRQHDPFDRNRQKYPAFKMPDGSVPVLEATLTLHSPEHLEWQAMTIGIPLALLEHPLGRHALVLHFSGVRWQMYVDGELLDNDFPFGYAQWAYLNQHGSTGTFPQATSPGFPAGSTYSVSADGISHFEKSHIMFHPCDNPSVYTDPKGRLRMLANYGSKGMWEAESINGPWRCIDPGFPPGGDCTIFFHWGRFDYIMGGFTGLWSKAADAPNSACEDLVRQGLDFYDGSNVPSITGIGYGRFLMAAWIPIRGWGGCLVIRELIQLGNGRIGSRWMPEIVPDTEKPSLVALDIADVATFPTESPSFMLTLVARPTRTGRGKLGMEFLPQNGAHQACEFQMCLDDLCAQFGPGSLTGFAGQEKSLRQGGSPHHARNYAIEKLLGLDRPFTVRVIVKADEKIGGSLIDAEIAAQRTMISYVPI